MKTLVIVLGYLAFIPVALAQQPECLPLDVPIVDPSEAGAMGDVLRGVLGQFLGPVGLDNVIGYMMILMLGLRVSAETLGKIADKTETKWDNEVAHKLGEAINGLAWLIGLFGFSQPKSVKPVMIRKLVLERLKKPKQ